MKSSHVIHFLVVKKSTYLIVLGALLIFSCQQKTAEQETPHQSQEEIVQEEEPGIFVLPEGAEIEFYHLNEFPTELITPRAIDIWFPKSFSTDKEKRFPVLYFWGEEHLFSNSESSYIQLDKIAQQLMDEDKIEEFIIVSVLPSDNQLAENIPQKPLEYLSEEEKAKILKLNPKGDQSAQFLFEDLKPFIDARFRTLPTAKNTCVAGIGKNAITALETFVNYSGVFGNVIAENPYWFLVEDFGSIKEREMMWIEYLGENLKTRENKKLYLNSTYSEINTVFKENGYQNGIVRLKNVNWNDVLTTIYGKK